jgi:hypothetical protein
VCHEDGNWSLLISCYPLGEEVKVERFKSSKTFLWSSPTGTQFSCRLQIKKNVLHYTCTTRYIQLSVTKYRYAIIWNEIIIIRPSCT